MRNTLNPPHLQASQLQIGLCTKRIRFKPFDDAQNDEDIEIQPGFIVDTGVGSPLATVQIPEGRYRRIDIDLDDRCGRQVSVLVTNTFGTFASTDGMRIRFEGTLTVSASQTVYLQMDPIRRALAGIQSNGEIEPALEEIGSLSSP